MTSGRWGTIREPTKPEEGEQNRADDARARSSRRGAHDSVAVQAATVELVPTYKRAASVEWHWYLPSVFRVWYRRKETEHTYNKLVEIGAGSALAA